ncbi:unnamed protein product [Linum trigynum]|uniref:CCHC-type domain-containing protein n=1 Tax=Linum trigynum TaxID=586398 RepID=A0AAV2FA80_9ROSI
MSSGSTSAGIFMADGFSQTRPPRFEGVHYGYRRNRMELFICSTDPDLWNIVLDGPLEVKETRGKWTEEDKRNFQLNSKATNLMYCTLGPEEYHRVTGCKSAKEIWEKLQIAHKGKSHVKISRINSLKQDFESFVMKPEESIKEMNERFTTIVNSLRNLEVEYASVDLVRKVLWALPKKWTPKVTTIEESKDLTRLSLDELIGSLITHEEKLKREDLEEPKKEKRGIAFKVTSQEDELECLDEMEEEEFAMLNKHVAKLLKIRRERKRGNFPGRQREAENDKESSKGNRHMTRSKREGASSKRFQSQAECFKCGKQGHIKAYCPLTKKEKAYAT